jgi:hypothetical protein
VIELLDQLHARGVEVVTDGRRVGVVPAGSLTPPEREALLRFKGDLLHLLQARAALHDQYRTVLRRWWTLAAQGPGADREEIARIYQEIIKLIDEVGEPQATQLRRAWSREWSQETGLCPYCGEREVFHDPERGGEPA